MPQNYSGQMLNNRTIQAAHPGAVLRDETLPGLQIRVFRERKSFYLYYRTKEGRERRPKLGDYGVITLDVARKAARHMLSEVAAGRDPVAQRESARAAPTFAEFSQRYLDQYADQCKKKRSRDEDQRQIKTYLLPRLGARKVHEVQHEEVESLHAAMKCTPHQANRVLALLSKMFNLAEKWRLRVAFSNPCRHVRRYHERKRKRYMTSTEAPRIAELLRSYETRFPHAVAFIYLLILSGARPDEIARAKHDWIEVRGTGGTLHMPDTKTGSRPVYLPPQVMTLLKCIPGTGTLTGLKSPKHLWDRIRKEAGCLDLRLYDLRHTFASAALRAGYSLEQIGELLGHKNTQTTKRYTHLVDEVAQEAVAKTALVLEDMMSPVTPENQILIESDLEKSSTHTPSNASIMSNK